MRLPSGPMDGALPKKHVLQVLREHDVVVSQKGDRYILSTPEFVEIQIFPEMIPRRLIRHLGRRFDIDPFLFYYEGYDDGPPCK